MSKLNAQRAPYFRVHPTAKQFYFTADDMAFFDESNAVSHASHLKDRFGKSNAVDEVTREEYDAWEGNPAPAVEAEKTDYTKLTKEQLQELCRQRNIEFDPKANKALLVSALIAQDANEPGGEQ